MKTLEEGIREIVNGFILFYYWSEEYQQDIPVTLGQYIKDHMKDWKGQNIDDLAHQIAQSLVLDEEKIKDLIDNMLKKYISDAYGQSKIREEEERNLAIALAQNAKGIIKMKEERCLAVG